MSARTGLGALGVAVLTAVADTGSAPRTRHRRTTRVLEASRARSIVTAPFRRSRPFGWGRRSAVRACCAAGCTRTTSPAVSRLDCRLPAPCVSGRRGGIAATGPGSPLWQRCCECALPSLHQGALRRPPAGQPARMGVHAGSRPAKPSARSKAEASSETSITGPNRPSRPAARSGSADALVNERTAVVLAGSQANC
jgi:hypothetical protein